MTKARVAKGRRRLGYRRLRIFLPATLLALLVGLAIPLGHAANGLNLPPLPVPLPIPGVNPAQGSSGGAGFAPKHKRHRKHSTAYGAQGNPFRGRGMWIWYVSQSSGGNVSSIIARAHRYGISTLMIKSGDDNSAWSQFSPQLVATLHANGLRVCGWQFVYGDHPVGEARVGAATARAGADCLLIDAEGQYEGKYVSAQTYIRTLRRSIGASFPVALASFPYVDYHPAFPYSVFMGPRGAQYNVPQMYWVDIGTTVDEAYAHTYIFNRPYQRTISPLGQVYNSPPASDIHRFRQLSRSYAAPGVSWWDWQEATNGNWRAISQRVGSPSNFTPNTSIARLSQGAQGDLVVWAQEHLVSAGQQINVDGGFGPATKRAVRRFQSAHGISSIGAIGPVTWQALLRYPAARVRWTSSGAHIARAADGTGSTRVPKSASLPAKRYEIPRSLGAG